MSDSLPTLLQKPLPPTPPVRPVPPTLPTMPKEEEVSGSAPSSNMVDYNAVDVAQLKGKKITKPIVAASSRKPQLRKCRKGTSAMLLNAHLANKRTGGRISAGEYRKLVGKWLLSMLCWNALPVLFIVFALLVDCSADMILGAVIIGFVWIVIANWILFLRKGVNVLSAQVQRLNDLGWNGLWVVSTTVTIVVLSVYAANFVRALDDSVEGKLIAIAILLPGVLWGGILEGLSLFRKGQSVPNQYGLPCNNEH